MYHYHGFPYLNRQTWVQVKGLPAENGTFTALEITVAADEDEKLTRVQGVVQRVDIDNGKIYLSNTSVSVAASCIIRGPRGKAHSLSTLKTGDVLRVDGRYDENGRFLPQRLSLQRTFDFNLDRLFGCIEHVDEPNKQFGLFGLPVIVSESTSIELT